MVLTDTLTGAFKSVAGSEIIDFDALKGQRSNINLSENDHPPGINRERVFIQQKETLLNANPGKYQTGVN